MASEYISIRNLRFLLHEVFHAAQLQRYDRYQGYDQDAIDLTLDAARQLADQYLFPHYREMDKQKAYFENGQVHVPACVRPGIKALADGGWIAGPDDIDFGGQQMPLSLVNAGLAIFYAANGNLASNAFLTQGAANLIRAFASEALQRQYIPRMYSGEWQGTMALTEPQAGSSLSDITSSATPTPEGPYLIRGQKIFISGGDHNAVDNVVHLLLARIDGAPAGAKGISLFVVLKLREENGQLVSNDVTTAGIYGKMGQKGYVAAHLMLGEQGRCQGYLVGEPHKGLSYMFQMMNEARIGTGIMAAGTASGAYYASLQYARERAQGRHPSNKDVTLPPVLIIEHADVRRMLLFQKAVVEGSYSLLMQCSQYADIARCDTGQAAEDAHLLLELLTPIAKSYPSEFGIQAVSAGMQVLGGAGYTDDFPLEQYYRDIRVNAIYEGTTTIHGIDLLGRKITLNKGRASQLLAAEIQQTLASAQSLPQLSPLSEALAHASGRLQEVTDHLLQVAANESPEAFLADATLYLEMFSYVVLGWQWLRQATVAAERLPQAASPDEQRFYQSKLQTARYFMAYELVKTDSLHRRLLSPDRITLETDPELFM